MARKAKEPTGYVIYKGPSLLDGKPIVVIAITGKSVNAKTGNMVQTYILVDNNDSPVVNVKNLADKSICGDCIHRRGTGGACYVNLGQGPRSVHAAYLKGNYPYNPTEAKLKSKGRKVRLGTYGDPSAAPRETWTNLIEFADDHTGYSHQWKSGLSANIMDLVMASADSTEDYYLAKEKGYRTFRVRLESQPVLKGEFICPASKEGGKKKICSSCMACNGSSRINKASPTIIAHGSLAKRFVINSI